MSTDILLVTSVAIAPDGPAHSKSLAHSRTTSIFQIISCIVIPLSDSFTGLLENGHPTWLLTLRHDPELSDWGAIDLLRLPLRQL